MSNFESLPDREAMSEVIMRRAREEPMQLMFIGEDDSVAVGNTVDGFRYFDNEGNLMRRTDTEPFRLAGTNMVITRGLFGVEVPEQQPDDHT
jgi:hypothetical protein